MGDVVRAAVSVVDKEVIWRAGLRAERSGGHLGMLFLPLPRNMPPALVYSQPFLRLGGPPQTWFPHVLYFHTRVLSGVAPVNSATYTDEPLSPTPHHHPPANWCPTGREMGRIPNRGRRRLIPLRGRPVVYRARRYASGFLAHLLNRSVLAI